MNLIEVSVLAFMQRTQLILTTKWDILVYMKANPLAFTSSPQSILQTHDVPNDTIEHVHENFLFSSRYRYNQNFNNALKLKQQISNE